MLTTPSVSDPGWAWGYKGEHDGSGAQGACRQGSPWPHTSLVLSTPILVGIPNAPNARGALFQPQSNLVPSMVWAP